jgi:hypothetical protein
MKRTLTLAGVIMLLAFGTSLNAQRNNHNGDGGYNHNQSQAEYNHNNNNDNDGISEFRGFLVVNEREIRHTPSLGFHFNMNGVNITHIDFEAGPRGSSGYGIILQKPNGGHAFYRLDKKGSRIASRLMGKRNNHNRNVMVEVTGRMNPRQRIIEVVDMERIRNNRNNNHDGDHDGPGQWG